MSNDFSSNDSSWSSRNASENNERATIGPSITIRGEVSGSEDLMIQGCVEGTVNLRENTVTVGKSAKVKADIFGKTIHVDGEVTGNLSATEQIMVHKTGYVRGNITAPRLSLEDGARIKGSIDTEPQAASSSVSSHEIERVRTVASDDSAAKSKAAQALAETAKRTQLNGTRSNTTM